MREIELSFQKNIRDLGGLVGYQGKKVKCGRLFRGGFLNRINSEDTEILRSLNLTHIIDFRSRDEFINRPDYRLDNVQYFNFSPLIDHFNEDQKKLADGNLLWFVSSDGTGKDHMFKMYKEMVNSETGKSAYRQFFKLILDNPNGVFYFHCSQGKDRVGLASFYIEMILGVDMNTAIEDYLRSNNAMKIRVEYLLKMVENKPYFDEAYHQSLLDVFSAKEEYLNASIDEMIKNSGSILGYIEKELGVDIDKFRKIFLE